EIESAGPQRFHQRLGRKWVAMDVFDRRRDLFQLVTTRVQNRNFVATPDQTVDDQMSSGPRAADDQRLHRRQSATARRESAIGNHVRTPKGISGLAIQPLVMRYSSIEERRQNGLPSLFRRDFRWKCA